jgi:hypothetical protein
MACQIRAQRRDILGARPGLFTRRPAQLVVEPGMARDILEIPYASQALSTPAAMGTNRAKFMVSLHEKLLMWEVETS